MPSGVHKGLDKKLWAAEQPPFFPPCPRRRGRPEHRAFLAFESSLASANDGYVNRQRNTTCYPQGLSAHAYLVCTFLLPKYLHNCHFHIPTLPLPMPPVHRTPPRPSRWGSQPGSVGLTCPPVQPGPPRGHMDAWSRASWHGPGTSVLPADGRGVTRRGQATRARSSATHAGESSDYPLT